MGEHSLKSECYEVSRKDDKKFGCEAIGALGGINFFFFFVFRRKSKKWVDFFRDLNLTPSGKHLT